MLARGTRQAAFLVVAVAVLVALMLPAAAGAADPAAATISACKFDRLTVAGKVKLTGRAARKVRGAQLQMRFGALPLFGLPRLGQWQTSGKRTAASGQQEFTGLGADNWIGVLSWRFKKGRKTVMSGDERSQPVRIGSAKGKANCTLSEGAKPVDTTPPSLYLLPLDEGWHRAPATVQLYAQDDFSGVQSMRYALDGGAPQPIGNGGTFTIPTGGAHTVDWAATDVAGNTGTRSTIVRVDDAPPTKPTLTRPASVTANTTPTFQWSASTDSGSGLRGYGLTIRRADGSVLAFKAFDANTTSASSPVALTDGETYTATVTAVDNTADQPWTTDSDPLTFRVDTKADVASVAPAAGSVLAGSAKDTNFTITLDRPADPATVNSTNVKLVRNSESGSSSPSYTVGCAGTPCTKIVLDPSPSLTSSQWEGRYVLSLANVKSGDGEGLTFQPFSAPYSVPFLEDANGIDATGTTCLGNVTTQPVTLMAPSADEDATISFDWAYSGGSGWTFEVLRTQDSQSLGSPAQGGGGSGHVSIGIRIPSGTTSITLKLTRTCSGVSNPGQFTSDNLVGARVP